MQLELRHFRVVCAIADAGAIGRAAATLGVPQPSLATQLRRIEDAVGGRLFVRDRTGVTPTELGEYVITTARSILRQVDELQAHAHGRAAEQQPIHLGGMPGTIFTKALDVVQELAGDWEVVGRTELTAVALLDLLARGELDGAVMQEPPGANLRCPPGARARRFAVVPGFGVLSANHRLAGKRQVSLADLNDEDWVLSPPDGDGYRGYLRSVFAQERVRFHVAHEIADAQSALDMISRGKCLGLGQPTLPAHPGLVLKPLTGTPFHVYYVFAWRIGGALARHVDAIIDEVRADHLARLLATPVFVDWMELNGITPAEAIDPWHELGSDPYLPGYA